MENQKKTKLTLKDMLKATGVCLLLTAVELLLPGQWVSARSFRVVLYWIVVLIGWIIYLLSLYKNKQRK